MPPLVGGSIAEGICARICDFAVDATGNFPTDGRNLRMGLGLADDLVSHNQFTAVVSWSVLSLLA